MQTRSELGFLHIAIVCLSEKDFQQYCDTVTLPANYIRVSRIDDIRGKIFDCWKETKLAKNNSNYQELLHQVKSRVR